MSGVQALKRIPRIKFPQRHPKTSGSGSVAPASSSTSEADMTFLSGIRTPKSGGGRASDQPKRTPVSQEEIEMIMLGGNF